MRIDDIVTVTMFLNEAGSTVMENRCVKANG
jgi:hypothetical protein